LEDGDWNTVQRPAVDAWQGRHEQEAHDGEEIVVEIDPNPLHDR
jgi:hypothetical protein